MMKWYLCYKYDFITNIYIHVIIIVTRCPPASYPFVSDANYDQLSANTCSTNTQNSLDPITLLHNVLHKISRSTNWKMIHSLRYRRLWESSPWHIRAACVQGCGDINNSFNSPSSHNQSLHTVSLSCNAKCTRKLDNFETPFYHFQMHHGRETAGKLSWNQLTQFLNTAVLCRLRTVSCSCMQNSSWWWR